MSSMTYGLLRVGVSSAIVRVEPPRSALAIALGRYCSSSIAVSTRWRVVADTGLGPSLST